MNLKLGKKCYACKEDIDNDIDDFSIFLSGKDNFTLCESCKRDEKINKLFNGKLSLLNKIKVKLLTNNRIQIVFLGFVLVLLIVDIVLKIVSDIKWFSYIYNLFLVLYWIFTIYKYKLTTIKKPSH